MLILAGQGNPGPAYAGNRHNIGFRAVDAIAARWGFGPERSRFQGLAREGVIETPEGPVRARFRPARAALGVGLGAGNPRRRLLYASSRGCRRPKGRLAEAPP